MMIIAGGEPELFVGGMLLSERVGSMDAHMHYVCTNQNAVCTC